MGGLVPVGDRRKLSLLGGGNGIVVEAWFVNEEHAIKKVQNIAHRYEEIILVSFRLHRSTVYSLCKKVCSKEFWKPQIIINSTS